MFWSQSIQSINIEYFELDRESVTVWILDYVHSICKLFWIYYLADISSYWLKYALAKSWSVRIWNRYIIWQFLHVKNSFKNSLFPSHQPPITYSIIYGLIFLIGVLVTCFPIFIWYYFTILPYSLDVTILRKDIDAVLLKIVTKRR